jgi:NAD+ synthase (glutamine-hydrolysing)
MPSLRVIAAQMNPTVGDLEANLSRVVDAMAAAEAAGCDLICFPELVLTGYPPEDLLLKDGFVTDVVGALTVAAEASGDCVAIVGAVVPATAFGLGVGDAGDARGFGSTPPLCNVAAVLHRGDVVGVVAKRLLPNYAVFDEQRWFLPGAGPQLLFRVAGAVVGVAVCEDLWSASSPTRAATSS